MKKIISVFLFAVLIISTTACNANDTDISNSKTERNDNITSADNSSVGNSSSDINDKDMESNNSYMPSKEYDNVFPQHEPYGIGIGAMPGRVVWAHDPDSTEWDGNGYWWNPDNFDESAIFKMVNSGIASVEHTLRYIWIIEYKRHHNKKKPRRSFDGVK